MIDIIPTIRPKKRQDNKYYVLDIKKQIKSFLKFSSFRCNESLNIKIQEVVLKYNNMKNQQTLTKQNITTQ